MRKALGQAGACLLGKLSHQYNLCMVNVCSLFFWDLRSLTPSLCSWFPDGRPGLPCYGSHWCPET